MGTNRYIITLDGIRLYPSSGAPSGRDIAVSHCRTPMFSGHTRLPYSVAHHCVSAAELAQEAAHGSLGRFGVAYFTLLHELEVVAYGDIPGPLKIEEQRVMERSLRERHFNALGTPLPPDMWDLVEFYDKVEQAASVTWLGLAEPVHEKIWASCPDDLRKRAIKVTSDNWLRFHPRDQLEIDSPLVGYFLDLMVKYHTSVRQHIETRPLGG